MKKLLPWLGVGCTYLVYKLYPTSFNVLFLINIWVFSLPHTFATLTRSDRRSPNHLLLTMGLLILFTIAVMTFANTSGLVLLYSLYFYWQQFHYGKQNLGIAGWEVGEKVSVLDQVFYLSIVALSLCGLLGNGAQGFFGYTLYFPFNLQFSKIALFASISLLTVLYIQLKPKHLRPAIEHSLIFSLSYLYSEHFVLGWLLLNVFHNLQYLKFMKDYEKKTSYLIAPALLTGLLFLTQFHMFNNLILFSLPLSLTTMLALNFTHYTLDSLIWKRTS